MMQKNIGDRIRYHSLQPSTHRLVRAWYSVCTHLQAGFIERHCGNSLRGCKGGLTSEPACFSTGFMSSLSGSILLT